MKKGQDLTLKETDNENQGFHDQSQYFDNVFRIRTVLFLSEFVHSYTGLLWDAPREL